MTSIDEATSRTLFGETGYWEHLGDALRRREISATEPLLIQIVIPDDGFFAARSWHAEFDREIRSHLITERRITGQIIAPPTTLGAPAEPVLDLALDSGFDVRVLSTGARFVLYDGVTAILSETRGGTAEHRDPHRFGDADEHRATQADGVVAPLKTLFTQLWHAAFPWQDFAATHNPVLELLADGWTDERIAQRLGLSHRTVSRRVAAMMESVGAASRFELGMKHGMAAAQRRTKRTRRRGEK